MIECEFCKKELHNKYSLQTHQKTTKYCLKLQGKPQIKSFACSGCSKVFTTKQFLYQHQQRCDVVDFMIKQDEEKDKLRIEIQNLRETLKEINSKMSSELKLASQKEQKYIETIQELRDTCRENKETIGELQDCLKEIAKTSMVSDKSRIMELTRKYVKKQSRVQYAEKNVMYILTTASLKKDRRYIMGKATNLTSRLSTYNKTDEHEVVWYTSCGTKEDMNMVEPMVFKKLNECREQANRERFVLPVGETVDYFTRVVEEVVGFVL
jgi:hypothetical protein